MQFKAVINVTKLQYVPFLKMIFLLNKYKRGLKLQL